MAGHEGSRCRMKDQEEVLIQLKMIPKTVIQNARTITPKKQQTRKTEENAVMVFMLFSVVLSLDFSSNISAARPGLKNVKVLILVHQRRFACGHFAMGSSKDGMITTACFCVSPCQTWSDHPSSGGFFQQKEHVTEIK